MSRDDKFYNVIQLYSNVCVSNEPRRQTDGRSPVSGLTKGEFRADGYAANAASTRNLEEISRVCG